MSQAIVERDQDGHVVVARPRARKRLALAGVPIIALGAAAWYGHQEIARNRLTPEKTSRFYGAGREEDWHVAR